MGFLRESINVDIYRYELKKDWVWEKCILESNSFLERDYILI